MFCAVTQVATQLLAIRLLRLQKGQLPKLRENDNQPDA